MQLLTKTITDALLRNGRLQKEFAGTGAGPDFIPVVKLFTPDANATWLLTELDSEEPDIAFGLCDLGLGFPELASVSVSVTELMTVMGALGLPVVRDLHFAAHHTISVYAGAARTAGAITESRAALDKAAEDARAEADVKS